MEWQQDQDPEISVEDVFEITLDVKPETTFEGDLEYVEDSEGEDYPIFPPPSQKLLQQEPLYIPDEVMESEPYAEAKIEHISPKSPPKDQDMDLEEDTEDCDEIHESVFESIEEEDQSKGDSWFSTNGQMVMTKVSWPVMQFIRNYLKSAAYSQGPIWPVPNMNRSKKNEFCQKVSNYCMENGALFKYNKLTDRLNKGKTYKYIPSFLIYSRIE